MSGPAVVAFADLPDLVGRSFGPAPAITVTQDQIDEFAHATHDQQWIHVDPQRAADGPFGTTIAHGYLTLALSSKFLFDLLEVQDAAQVVNYGLEKVRFPAPVPSGSPVQMSAEITSVDEVRGGYQLAYTATFTVPGAPKPVCVMDGLFRYYGG